MLKINIIFLRGGLPENWIGVVKRWELLEGSEEGNLVKFAQQFPNSIEIGNFTLFNRRQNL